MSTENKLNKLFQIQNKIGAISKDSTNPFYSSKYFDINALLEQLKPLLNEFGVLVIQPLGHYEGQPTIKTEVIDASTGEVLANSEVVLPTNSDPQKMGSAITYFRRYALQSLFLLQAEDDDANKTIQVEPVEKPKVETVSTSFSGTKKVCPFCKAEHTGKFSKCIACWKREKDGETLTKTKTVTNPNADPFVGDEHAK